MAHVEPRQESSHAAISSDLQVPRRRSRVEELQSQIERLLPDLRIAVVFGGDKNSQGAVINPTINPRPWKSYESVADDIGKALLRIGFRNVTLVPDDMRLGDRLRQERIQLAWLNTGGVQGFGAVSHTPAMLEMFGIPYVGHNPLNAGSLDYKHLFKRDLLMLGIGTAPFFTWHGARGPLLAAENPRFLNTFRGYNGPFVVKPVSGRASLNVRFVQTAEELTTCVGEIYEATENHVLIESYLSGREFCVAVCGSIVARQGRLTQLSEPFAFSIVERVLDTDERIFTSMDQRPITTDRVRLLDPNAESELSARLARMAQRVFDELDLETLVRLDVRADETGRLCVMEANPKPDLAAPSGNKTSLVASGLAQEGMVYDDLILSLLADRIDNLLSQRRGVISHLLELTA